MIEGTLGAILSEFDLSREECFYLGNLFGAVSQVLGNDLAGMIALGVQEVEGEKIVFFTPKGQDIKDPKSVSVQLARALLPQSLIDEIARDLMDLVVELSGESGG